MRVPNLAILLNLKLKEAGAELCQVKQSLNWLSQTYQVYQVKQPINKLLASYLISWLPEVEIVWEAGKELPSRFGDQQ